MEINNWESSDYAHSLEVVGIAEKPRKANGSVRGKVKSSDLKNVIFSRIDFRSRKIFSSIWKVGPIDSFPSGIIIQRFEFLLFLSRIYLPELASFLLHGVLVSDVATHKNPRNVNIFLRQGDSRGFRRKFLTVTFIGRNKWNIFICQK